MKNITFHNYWTKDIRLLVLVNGQYTNLINENFQVKLIGFTLLNFGFLIKYNKKRIVTVS